MIRKAFSRARTALTGAAFGVALALSPAPAHAFWDTSKAWNDLLQFAVKQVNAPGEFEIILGEVTKPEDGFALISTLQIRDSDGVWFDASNLLVDWSPTALLRGRFTFETLSAEQISILRAPIGRGDPPAEEGPGVEFAWPRPPVPISIDALKVDRLRIEGGLLPQDLEAKIDGAFSDIGDIQDANLTVQRTDRPGDRITLKSRIDFDDLDITFALKATEEPGGLVAQMGNLPPDQALELDLDAKGTPERLPFNLFADIGQIGVARGAGVASWGGLITAKFNGTVEPGEETSADWKRALGEAARIDVDFEETERGTYSLKMLEVDSEAFELSGKGIVDVGKNAVDMALDWDVKDIDAFNQVIAPASVTDLSGTARAVGKLTAPQLDVDAQVAGLDASFGKAETIELKIDSQPLGGEVGEAGKQQGFTFDARAKGLELADAGIQDALGPTPGFSGTGKFDGIASTVTLDTLKVESRSVMLDGSAKYDISIGKADAQLAGEARELGPFFRAAGLPIDGRAALAFKLEGLQGGTLDRLFLNAQMADLSSTDADIAAALGEEAVLEILLTESGADTIRVERGSLDSDVLLVEASGTVSIPGDTVDLAVEFDLRDAAAVTALIEPAKIGGAAGKATLTGTLSEPKIAVDATASDIGFEEYSATGARIDGDVQYRKDRRAPFALTAALEGVKTGDDDLDRVVGTSPVVEASGLYDTATGLLDLDAARVDLADADIELAGKINLQKQTLDITYDLEAGDLSGFAPLVGTPLAGSVDLAGSAQGPFALPFVTAKGSARDLRYDTYSVEAADLDIEMRSGEEGPSPFRIDITATNPKTGDAGLDALIGDNPVLKTAGTLDRAGPAVTLDYLDADLAGLKAEAAGSIDLGTRLLDLTFDVEAGDLSGLDAVLGTEIAGAVTAKGKASGSFTTPEVTATIDGSSLRYDAYSVGSVKGDIDIRQAPTGFAPFDIDVEARDVTTGDAALDDLLAGASTLRAKGEIDQSEQKVRIASATLRAAGAEASLSGDVDIAAQSLDIAFDLEADDLSPFEPLAGVKLAGAATARGTARGTLAAPEADITLSGKGLRYDAYAARSVDGTVVLRDGKDGYAPFDVDVRATGLSLGDPALDEALEGGIAIDAAGGIDRAGQRLRLTRATLTTDAATADVAGTVDLKAKTLDVRFDVDADDLSILGLLAGADMGGALAAKGTAKGPFALPAVTAEIDGTALRYDTYRVAALSGTVAMDSAPTGPAPFDMDLTANGIRTGDAALDDVIGGEVALDAKGAFDRAANRIRLDAATLDSGFATAEASGSVDLAAKTLDIAFDLDARRLAALKPLLGTDIAGAVALEGTAKGPFVLPALDATVAARDIVYDTYSVARLDGRVDMGSEGDALPFDVDLTASGIGTGDPALDAALGETVSVDARGRYDRAARKLRLDSAALDADFATATASGDVDLAAKTLDIAFDLDAQRLAPFGPLAKADLGGALKAKGTARGPFALPSLDVTVDGRALRYDRYAVGALTGDIDVGRPENGTLPFDIDVTARGIATGDPALDGAIGEAVTLDATGTFDRDDRVVILDAARFDADFAEATAQGAIDLKAQTVDVGFDVTATDLSPVSAFAGSPVSGSIAMRGTARGPFSLPAIDATVSARDLGFDAYGAGALDGSVSLGLPQDGFAPFAVDMEGAGLSLGDPALEAAFGARLGIDARGAVDIAQRRIRLDRAALVTDSATVAAQGSVDLTAKQLDVTFDVEAGDLTAFGPLAGADIGGALAVQGSARGPFVIPRVNARIAGTSLRYRTYTVARLDGAVDMEGQQGSALPFSATLTAAGIGTGDPALDRALGGEVRVAATGAFDRQAKLLTLAEANVSSALGQVGASGTVDLAAQSLDIGFSVDTGDLGVISGLVGADIGGTLAAGGRVTGPFSAPSVATTFDGRALRYAQYSVGSLTGRASFAAVPEGYGPFEIDATAAGIATGDPALDFALERGVSLAGRGGFDIANRRLRLDGLTARTGFATVSASGNVDIEAQILDIGFDLDASDLSPLGAVAGKPVGGALKASGTARGGFAAPVVNMRADGGGLYYDAYSLGSLSLDLKMPSDAPGYLPFALTGTLGQPRLDNPQIESLIGETVSIRAVGVFDPTRRLLRLTDTRVATATASVNAFGDIDLASSLLEVSYSLDARDLSIAQPLAGKALAGAARANGRVTGALADPSVVGRLNGANILYDTYRISEMTAFYDLQRLISNPAGSVALNAQTDLGPVSAKARFALSGGSVQFAEVTADGLGFGLDGKFSTGINGVLDGSATFTAADLAQIGALVGQDIAGQINGTVTLGGDRGRQNATFDVVGNSLRYGPADDPTVKLTTFNAKGQVYDALGADPYVDAVVGGSDGTLAAFPVKRIDATAKGSFSALDTTLIATGGALGSDKIETAARLNIADAPRSARVSRLALVFDGRQAAIVEPLVIEEIPPGGFRVGNLDLRAEDGEVRGGLEYAATGLVANLRIRNFPLALASLSGVDVIRSGRLDGTVDVDTRGGVRGNFALTAYALRLKGAQIDDPFAVTATGTMDGTALNARAELTGAQLVQPLTASARIPLISTPGAPLPTPNRNAPFSAQVDWQGDVGEIWAFVPLPDHILSGPVVINGRATGTLAAPNMAGGAVLTDGRYSNVEFGTLLTNLNAKADFTQDGRAVFDLTANDGVQGTVAASGSYVVANGTLDTRLALNNAALVRRDDATAILSGEATAVSQGRNIAVNGNFRTNYVEVRLIGNFGGGLTVVDAIPVGKSAPLYVPPVEETAESRKILLNVSLSMPNRVFVRGRGLDSEWGGQLKVAGTASNPRINGTIEKRRGVLDFLGKQFDLAIGTVRFTGTTLPFVQVRLQRESNDITGWIEVKGRVPDIAIEFGSIPALPEGEVLPRLLFGRSKQSLTALEAAQLAAGVATLLSGKAGVLDSVRDAVGVDVLRVESDIDGGTSIITGKYLRDEVFVGAKQNLQTGSTSGLVEVEVFDQFEIEAELGSEEAKGSVGWQIEY